MNHRKALRIKDSLWVHFEGKIYSLPAILSRARPKEEQSADLIAPFACKVLRVAVQAKQNVKKGDLVAVVEAMKMEYSYYSPKDGEIDAILIHEGEVLQAGKKFLRWKEPHHG